MNIFYVDHSPLIAAQSLCDKHVVKMTLETAQLLSTAHHLLPSTVDKSEIYRKTHENHPSAVWVREGKGNYLWLLHHFYGLLNEYKHRYGKVHACAYLIPDLATLPKFPFEGSTAVKLAMPEEFKGPDPVIAYRRYYISKYTKIDMSWTKRDKPAWFGG